MWIVIIILIILFLLNFNKTNTKESFCPYGYCDLDNQRYEDFISHFKHKYPSKCHFTYQGYDNPYIYPYNYFMNQNHPLDRFKYPGWARQLSLDKNNYMNFPGYTY